MIPFFKAFWKMFLYDASFPERAARFVLALVGQFVASGGVAMIPPSWEWAGHVLTAGALLIGAGEKNAAPKPQP